MNIIVKNLEVRGFRGFKEACLDDFVGINILVGRNATGKSTILEALYLAFSLDKGLEFIVKRRGWFGLASVDSLIYGGYKEAKITVGFSDGKQESITIKPGIPISHHLQVLESRGLDLKHLYTLDLIAQGKIHGTAKFYVDVEGRTDSLIGSEEMRKIVHNAVFIDWNVVLEYGRPEEAYTYMTREGGAKAKEIIVKSLQKLYAEIVDIEPLKVYDEWVLHLIYKDKAIPYYVVGDGIRYALTYLMIISACRSSVLLLEEPELHMHPGLMELIAAAIVGAYGEQGNQIFLSTHSLELIDMIIEEAKKIGLKDNELKIYRLTLKEGKLYSEAYSLNEAIEARKKLEWDLRS